MNHNLWIIISNKFNLLCSRIPLPIHSRAYFPHWWHFSPNAFGMQSLWYGRLFRIIYSLLIIFSQKAHVKQSLCSVWPYHGQDTHNLFLGQNWAETCPRNSELDGELNSFWSTLDHFLETLPIQESFHRIWNKSSQYFVFWTVCNIFYEKYSSRLAQIYLIFSYCIDDTF